jgi:hypothetical protein
MVSDVRVSWNDGTEADLLRKAYRAGPFLLAGFAGSVNIGFQLIGSLQNFLLPRTTLSVRRGIRNGLLIVGIQSGTNFRKCIGLWYGNRINTERCQRLETTPATAELLYFDVVREMVIPVLPQWAPGGTVRLPWLASLAARPFQRCRPRKCLVRLRVCRPRVP